MVEVAALVVCVLSFCATATMFWFYKRARADLSIARQGELFANNQSARIAQINSDLIERTAKENNALLDLKDAEHTLLMNDHKNALEVIETISNDLSFARGEVASVKFKYEEKQTEIVGLLAQIREFDDMQKSYHKAITDLDYAQTRYENYRKLYSEMEEELRKNVLVNTDLNTKILRIKFLLNRVYGVYNGESKEDMLAAVTSEMVFHE